MDINATLLVEMVIFLAFLTLTKHFVWGRIVAVMDERRAIIAEGLQKADQAKNEQAKTDEAVRRLLKEASNKAQQIVKEAQKEAQVLLNEAKQSCQVKLMQHEKEMEALTAQIEKKAQSRIEKQMLTLATEICQKALNESVDSKVSRKMIEKQIGEAA